MSLVAYGNSSGEEDEISDQEEEQEPQKITTLTGCLPQALPTSSLSTSTIIEEDDEFLRKKAIPAEKPPPPKKGPVKISIPALSDFKDLDNEDAQRPNKKPIIAPSNKPSGLLNMLPKPKAEQLFTNTNLPTAPGTIPKTTTRSLVPHSVAKKATASKTPLPGPSTTKKLTEKPKKPLIPGYDSSGDEEEGTAADFFSLTTSDKDTLPEVSKNEINLMVARKSAKIAEVFAKYDRLEAQEEQQRLEKEAEAAAAHQSVLAQQQAVRNQTMDAEALQLLVGGSRAKRARMADVDMIELSHDQVMPSKDEWMRTAVASSTTAQVRGQLKDGPKGVAKKKHQITYLAHQAKSNEAELQAIWAANRTTQRQSQSKYGW